PLAGIYAMFHTLRRYQPVRIEYDNKTLQTSLFFLGNSTYLPSARRATGTRTPEPAARGRADCARAVPAPLRSGCVAG
ncbi:hypothetical protein C6A85_14770, partial [Mycobacterium sp. ITM-2017-0098]